MVYQNEQDEKDMRAYIADLTAKGVEGLEGPNTTDAEDIDRWVREYYWARDYRKQAEAKKALKARIKADRDAENAEGYEWDPEALDLRMAVINMHTDGTSGDDEIPGFEFLHELSREDLTDLCINSLSLCPIHRVDWAICFDDRPADCAQVRLIYPNSHDT